MKLTELVDFGSVHFVVHFVFERFESGRFECDRFESDRFESDRFESVHFERTRNQVALG